MYALGTMGTITLVNRLSGHLPQVWYANDATACVCLSDIRFWWDQLLHIGPDFGYFPNSSKICVIVKEQFYDEAVRIFQGSKVSVMAEGKRHLGAALGSPSFINSFVEGRVSTRIEELCSQNPHAAYAGFIHGFIGK